MKIVLKPGDTVHIGLDEAFDDFVTISYGGEVKDRLTVRERNNTLYELSLENPFGDGEREEGVLRVVTQG